MVGTIPNESPSLDESWIPPCPALYDGDRRQRLIANAIKFDGSSDIAKKRRRKWSGGAVSSYRVIKKEERLAAQSLKENPRFRINRIGDDLSSWGCCSCMPKSRSQLMNRDISSAGFIDVLAIPYIAKQRHWSRVICDVSFVWNQRFTSHYVDFTKVILEHSRLTDAIKAQMSDDVANDDKLASSYLGKAKRIVARMSARFSLSLIRFTGWFLHKIFKRLLSSIIVHKGQMYVVQQTCKRKHPVVFLPTHRSHLDYILLSFILFNFNTRIPYVAAGDNLNIPFFGGLMRGLGGFFIRRKMDSRKNKRDHLYRAVLQTYIEEVLKRGELVEFYLEGGRSRSGKILHPKTGLLSIVVDAYLQGVVEDVCIVPVSISYEKLPEVNFIGEQLGLKKKNETFWGALVEVYRSLFGFYGSVRLEFCQPYSLMEFVCSWQAKAASQNLGLIKSASDCSFLCPNEKPESRVMVQKLAEHVSYDQGRIHPISSVHLTAWILLTIHRQGATMDEFLVSFDETKKELVSRGHGMGFVGLSRVVVKHACNLLGKHLVKVIQNSDGKEFLEPCVRLPNVMELSYYANSINMIFSADSVIANTIYSLNDMKCKRKNVSDLPADPMHIFEHEVIEEALLLCHLFKYEFVFAPACMTLEEVVASTFYRFKDKGIIRKLQHKEENENEEAEIERERARRIAAAMTDMSGDYEGGDGPREMKETYELDFELMETFLNMKNVLGPVMETYRVVSTHLYQLLTADAIESEFVKTIHEQLKKRCSDNLAEYEESASLDTLKNSILSLVDCQVITTYESSGLHMISLSGDFRQRKVLDQFVARLASFSN